MDAISGHGDVWVVDNKLDRVQEFNEAGGYEAQFGSAGTGDDEFKNPVGIAIEPGSGDIFVSDQKNQRIQELSSTGAFIRAFGFGVSNGEAKFETCTSACKAGTKGTSPGELDDPAGLAIGPGGTLWVVNEAGDLVDEYSETGEYIKDFGSKGSGTGELLKPLDIAYDDGDFYVTEAKNQRVQEFNQKGEFERVFGSEGSGNGEFETPTGIAAAPKSGDLYVTDSGNDRVEEFTPTGKFAATFGAPGKGNGQFEEPGGIVATEAETLFVVDEKNDRVEKWTAAVQAAHDTKTIYYTAAANPEYLACGERPEFANLPCEVLAVAQPHTTGLPELASTKITYNFVDEPETTTETTGTTSRTETNDYDEAGRQKSMAVVVTGKSSKANTSRCRASPMNTTAKAERSKSRTAQTKGK